MLKENVMVEGFELATLDAFSLGRPHDCTASWNPNSSTIVYAPFLFLSAAICQRPRNYLSCCCCSCSSCSPFGSFPH